MVLFVGALCLASFRSPYDGDQYGRLTLRIDPKYGKDVIFSIQRGQLLCASYEGSPVFEFDVSGFSPVKYKNNK